MRDEIFKQPISKQFEFDKNVASVFDDMINRSVPFYEISSNLIISFLIKELKSDAKIVDLGCSTASMLLKLFEKNSKFNLVGIDNSFHMLEIAKNKTKAFGANIEFICADILNSDFKFCDCVILNYTLQFIRPLLREKFIDKIYQNLNKGGVFVLSEKIFFEDKRVNKQVIDIYENYKENQGYSKFEISQKREALENVLIPFSEDENKNMLKKSGFKMVETIFKWGNFATFLAIK
ncbi:carboxy-S-adenosyl-L-methionine synthase CmoA [Campylobacter sp. FMV-PI01]|uniref:Carboxy-S-adenosyl-L-methionine synthase n=1 Tax=Campylobacter portucalensis TaxID=2608384 RepID=A0A6L5WMB9_9BACT|nr:carboxy-S-adenosyl-L-methionine synthase CmoA [Campylobacter portucalensis]MSN96973.1 carboxy-S-adenosyl-L-methionine synthase CmoA [Campylobacter portucalensis]